MSGLCGVEKAVEGEEKGLEEDERGFRSTFREEKEVLVGDDQRNHVVFWTVL